MSTDQLSAHLEQLLALPPADRFWLATALLESVDDGADFPSDHDPAFLAELQRRCAEMASNPEIGRSHEEVVEEVRRIVECA
jgi:putative addiction module component (TIGR02574 family)